MKRVSTLILIGLTGTLAAWAQEPRREHRELSDADRARMEERANATWSKMAVREKVQLLRLHRALREMPPDERRFVHERIERFLNMSPADRERLKKNRERWEQMTPEERQRYREEFRRRRPEFEQQWRPGHNPPPEPQPEPTEEKP